MRRLGHAAEAAELDRLRHDRRRRRGLHHHRLRRGLRDDDRLVLGCRYLLELSEAETAAALSVKPGTVKSRTSRALDRLRGQL